MVFGGSIGRDEIGIALVGMTVGMVVNACVVALSLVAAWTTETSGLTGSGCGHPGEVPGCGQVVAREGSSKKVWVPETNQA